MTSKSSFRDLIFAFVFPFCFCRIILLIKKRTASSSVIIISLFFYSYVDRSFEAVGRIVVGTLIDECLM